MHVNYAPRELGPQLFLGWTFAKLPPLALACCELLAPSVRRSASGKRSTALSSLMLWAPVLLLMCMGSER